MDDDSMNTKTTPPAGPSQPQRPSGFESVRQSKRSPSNNECDTMFARLQEIVLDGLQHGFFDCLITCELVKDRRRRVVIRAGKNHLFSIREEDLQN
jgi:hypothetical protein